jgi:hypothetical protein
MRRLTPSCLDMQVSKASKADTLNVQVEAAAGQ